MERFTRTENFEICQIQMLLNGMKLWVLPFDLADQVLIDSEQTTLPIGFHVFEKKAA